MKIGDVWLHVSVSLLFSVGLTVVMIMMLAVAP
jgi:hypothetical protein